MKAVVFHGSPRKGNTYKAARIFMEGFSASESVEFTEFFLPESLPAFCTGCQLCLGNPNDKCPHEKFVTPILNAILKADALIFTTPHYASTMSSGLKNLLEHLDFLTMTVAPKKEIFEKKAFVLTTGAGSKAGIKPIKSFLKNWGINRVYAYGIRMFTDKWEKMPEKKRRKVEAALFKKARLFFKAKKKRPYFSTAFLYKIHKLIIKKYIGAGNYPYEYWKENGFFNKRPF